MSILRRVFVGKSKGTSETRDRESSAIKRRKGRALEIDENRTKQTNPEVSNEAARQGRDYLWTDHSWALTCKICRKKFKTENSLVCPFCDFDNRIIKDNGMLSSR